MFSLPSSCLRACVQCCRRLLPHVCGSCLLAGCRCCSSLSSHHHSSVCPQMCCAIQCSVGGRRSLRRDLVVCQGDAQTQSGTDVELYSAPVLSAVGTGGSISPQAVPVILMGPLLLHTMKASTSSHHCYYISTLILSMNKQLLGKNRISVAPGLATLDCSLRHCQSINAHGEDITTISTCSPVWSALCQATALNM